MKPLETTEQVFDIAFAYMGSKALFAALHVGVFDALADGPKPLATIARDTDCGERSLLTLLTALVSIGLLAKEGDEYSNAPASQAALVSGPAGGFADYCRHQVDRQMYPFLHNVADVIRGRRDTVPFEDYEAWFSDSGEASLYSEAQHAVSLPTALLLAAVSELKDCRRLLDIGGGSGAFSITLCQQNPDLEATIIDFANVAEVGRRYIAEAGLSDRIEYLCGNALEIEWPFEQDVVLLSYVSGSVSEEGVSELYRRASRVLRPGGRIIIHDFMVDDDRKGPPLPALWALQHCAFTPGAVGLTRGFICGALEDCGFEKIKSQPFVPGMTTLITASVSERESQPEAQGA